MGEPVASLASRAVDLVRAAAPLQVVLRVAFAAVVVAACFVDQWVIGGSTLGSNRVLAMQLGSGGIAVLGVAFAAVPRIALPLAAAASALSLLVTNVRLEYGGPGFGFFVEYAVLPVLLAAVLVRPSWQRWPVAALVVVAGSAICLRDGPGVVRTVLGATMLVLFGAAVTAVVYLHLRENERRLSIEQAREKERRDLARELHDVVGHHVTGIVVLAQASRFTSGAEPGSPAERALADIEAAGVEMLASVRRLVGLLRTDQTAPPPPRVADIERIVDDLRITHPDTTLHVDDELRASPPPADLALTIQRLVQEAATNVRRHGDPAAPVTFALRTRGGALEVCADNRMLRPPADTGYGLVGMRERVDALGGTFRAGPDGDRWRLHAVIPTAGRTP